MRSGLVQVVAEEFWLALRTRRLIVLLAMYVLLALLVSGVTVFSLREAERLALEEISERGIPPEMARQLMTDTMERGVDEVARMMDKEPSDFHPLFRGSLPLAVFFFMATSVIPFGTLAVSFDLFASDLRARSFCFATLRYRRRDILLGRVIAHTTMLVVANSIAAAIFIAMAGTLLTSFQLGPALQGAAWTSFLLLFMCAAFVGISAFASVSTRRPGIAFAIGFGIFLLMAILRIPGGLASALGPEWQWMSNVPKLVPYGWYGGLWSSHLSETAIALAVYTLYAVGFVLLGLRRFSKEDL
jgi:ABC-type transport system involved in multi-copper enzyme maturation permease subunit